MTHCVCCDKLLNDYESTLRHGVTFEYLDTCKACLKPLKGLFPVIERKDLITSDDVDNNPSDDEAIMDTGDYDESIMYFKGNIEDLNDF
jgi:hypothetical protein